MNAKRSLCLLLASFALGLSTAGCGSGDGADDASTAAAMKARNARRQGAGGAPPTPGAPAPGTTTGK